MRFLAFEGLDGSGKSTLIQGVQAELTQRQIDFVATFEPGGSALGAEIRQMLLRTQGEAPVPRAEVLLYQAARAQHVETLIRPAIEAGRWVLSDRFDASSMAFQVAGRSLKASQIEWLNEFAKAGVSPDLYVLLDIPVEESSRRLNQRGELKDRFEREAQDFHQRVRDGYLALASANPAQWLVLSSLNSPSQVLRELLQALQDRQWLN